MAMAMTMPAGGGVENHVPHYDVFGHQHSRSPFKDKSYLLEKDITHAKWLDPAPEVKTRADLQQARHRSRVPDSTYDFDGDGVVGQLDHFIGRSFDKNNDGSLTQSERRRAKEALDNGFLDRYVRGLEATGDAQRGCAVRQRRGVITSMDNTQDVSRLTHGPHHNSNVQPPHATRTALQVSRTAEAKAAGQEFGNRVGSYCAPVPEPLRPDHRSHPRTCPVENLRERAEADHQAARARGGLLPRGTVVNPEREHKSVGLDYVEQPLLATRGALIETRKEMMRQEAEAQALKAAESSVPLSVRRTKKYSDEFEFRRPDHEPMTMTRLKEQRRQERIEHDMRNFARPSGFPREYPRFSDNPEVPFWMADHPEKAATMGSPPSPALSRRISEPALKVGHAPFAHEAARPSAGDLPPHATSMAAAGKAAQDPSAAVGSRTVKRWTAEMIERGEGRNKPRYFDSIQPVRIGPMDLQDLDHRSSFELIRKSATERLRADNAHGLPMTSRLWSDPSLPRPPTVSSADAEGSPGPRGRKTPTIRSPQKVQSEPALRSGFDRIEVPNEPRFFGTVAHMTRPTGETAVRCGGFHRLGGTQDRPYAMASKPGSPQQVRPGRATKGGEQAMASA
mmetsp:Transcript_112746/g.324020  ORF Transcript_112746/g.324020 Transcript_112746/m.324020 type:complete len:622 (-) Transcript_112746:86-1951(-)